MALNHGDLEQYVAARAQKQNPLAKQVAAPENGRFLHTPREILQQPFMWRDTAARMVRHAPNLLVFLKRAGLFNDGNRPVVVLTGAGTSDYVGLSVGCILREHFRTIAENWSTTRITASPSRYLVEGQPYVMMHFARSGNSPESQAVLEMALKRRSADIRHVVITCNEDGILAQIARENPEKVYLVLLHGAANDRALAMTSSFTSMVVAAQALAHLPEITQFADLTDRTALAAEYLIETYTETLAGLASTDLERAFFLGNNDLLGAAAESALKVQEMTRGEVVAKSDDPLGFRHGPISAVGRNSLVTLFLSEDAYTRRYELDVIVQYQHAFHEMRAKALIVCGALPGSEIASLVNVVAYDPDGHWQIPPLYQVNLGVIAGQIIGLFASLNRGLDVDDPSDANPLYSRTVQGVTLYELDGTGG